MRGSFNADLLDAGGSSHFGSEVGLFLLDAFADLEADIVLQHDLRTCSLAGSFDDLVRRGGTFAELARAQFLIADDTGAVRA